MVAIRKVEPQIYKAPQNSVFPEVYVSTPPVKKNGKKLGKIINLSTHQIIAIDLNTMLYQCFHILPGNYIWDMSETTPLQM